MSPAAFQGSRLRRAFNIPEMENWAELRDSEHVWMAPTGRVRNKGLLCA